MNMLHIISVPSALMKVNPLSWIQKVCQYKGNLLTSGCIDGAKNATFVFDR